VCDDINSFEFTVTTTTTVQELGVLQEMPTPNRRCSDAHSTTSTKRHHVRVTAKR
jgi:hypothetical protein